MKVILYLAAFGIFTVCESVTNAEEEENFPKHKLAKDFEACPNGHKELKNVPIIWGHFELFGKHPRDYTEKERELDAKRDRHEIEFGGDILPQNPPKFRVVCNRCGFTFYPSDLTTEQQKMLNVPPDWDAYWSKNSKDTVGFPLPFSKQLLSFPQIKADSGTVSYSQTLSANAKNLEQEMISYSSSLSVDQILEGVRKWLKENGRDPDHLKRVENASAHQTYDYNEEGIWIMLRDENDINPGKVSVSLMLIKKKR
jgi:hypothetical protein